MLSIKSKKTISLSMHPCCAQYERIVMGCIDIKTIDNMNLKELLSCGANVIIAVTPTDLKEFALCLIRETLSARNQEPQSETYLTPDEAALELGVSPTTLWRWDKTDYLKPVKVGRKSRYRRSDIDFLLSKQRTQNDGKESD